MKTPEITKEWRTFKAVFLRNLKLYTGYKAWVIATVIWPIPLLALNIYTYYAFGTEDYIAQRMQGYGISSFAGMVIIGTIVYLLYNRLLWGTGVSIQSERWMGTIEALFLTPANKMTVLIACGLSSVVEASWWIVSILLLSSLLFGVTPNIVSGVAMAVCLISTVIALISIGVFFAGFFVLTRAADQLAGGLQAPIRFFSGVAFPVTALPQMLQYVSYLIPVTYGISTMRSTILAGGDLGAVWMELISLYVMAAVFLIAGRFCLRVVERQAKRKGTLYQY